MPARRRAIEYLEQGPRAQRTGGSAERHLERVRELAERIESELPFVGLPRVSPLVAGAAFAQARDEGAAAGSVAGAMLAAYAHLVYTGKIEQR